MDFKKLQKNIDKALAEILNKKTFDDIGKDTAEQIKKRTRLGKGVSKTEGQFEPLKPTSDATKAIKKAKKKAGKLSPETTPNRSNLTDSGELLNSLKWQSTDTEVRIYIEGADNVKKAQDQVKQGRKFMNLSKTEVNQIVKFLSKKIKDSFNKG